MPNPIVDAAVAQITASDNVIDSAVVLVNQIAQMITDAVAAAIANGATPAELLPVSDLTVTLKTKSDALAAAVAANTPAPAPTPAQAKKIARLRRQRKPSFDVLDKMK
jgi:hypothetical protein